MLRLSFFTFVITLYRKQCLQMCIYYRLDELFQLYFSFPHTCLVGKIILVTLTYLLGLQNNTYVIIMMVIIIIIIIIIILPSICTCCTWYEVFISIFKSWSCNTAVYILIAVWRKVVWFLLSVKRLLKDYHLEVCIFVLNFPFLYGDNSTSTYIDRISKINFWLSFFEDI